MSAIADKLGELIEIGWRVDQTEYAGWQRRVSSFLHQALDEDSSVAFRHVGRYYAWNEARDFQIGMLEGLALRVAQDAASTALGAGATAPQRTSPPTQSKRVFVVHGRDTEAKESVARFIERIGLEPVILHEQPSSGRTVIEKFEVLLTSGLLLSYLLQMTSEDWREKRPAGLP